MTLRLHPKYGVNPTILRCFFCNETKNEVALLGAGYSEEAPPSAWAKGDYEPCDSCKEVMQDGVILVSVADTEKPTRDGGTDNPNRTGGWCVVRDEAIRRLFDAKSAEDACKRRAAFVSDEAWDRLGLPRRPLEGVASSLEEYRAQKKENPT